MGYTAIEDMRRNNRARFGKDVGPFCPISTGSEAEGFDLKSAALRFLDIRCEGLRFDAQITAEEVRTGRCQGTSLAPDQIPYNMQMDVDRLCLRNELARFIDSGVASDAYTVYYAWLEMFMGSYGRSQTMVELLSEFESNASSLLMSHRDHYSHSVYVFVLGLAIYETNAGFRETFHRFYGFGAGQDHEAACFFLRYWGLTALFHDIGYPFEIPFEQLLSYFEVDRKQRGKGSVYIAFQDIEALIRIGEEDGGQLERLFERPFTDLPELLAFGITDRLGSVYRLTEVQMDRVIRNKPVHPEYNNYYMDHAFFSACRLYQEIIRIQGAEALTRAHVDALCAIMLHNSMFKFAVAFYKTGKYPPLSMSLHPLAWLLMLCDELQCWDRIAYGRNSRTELHPISADFDFSGNAIHATYGFDEEERPKIRDYEKKYMAWRDQGGKDKPPRLKAYSDMAEKEQRFTTDIGRIVDLTGYPLSVDTVLRPIDRGAKHTYLSSSSFLHLYDFAVALHARYLQGDGETSVTAEEMEQNFNAISLEYKILNINQARSFDRYLNAIGCFYTDRPVDFEPLRGFTPEMVGVFAPMEHVRWVRDHQAMGWTPGNEYETLPLGETSLPEKKARQDLREQLRMHALTMDPSATDEEILRHYETLSEADQGKDYLPFNRMLGLMKKFDGARIYMLGRDDV